MCVCVRVLQVEVPPAEELLQRRGLRMGLPGLRVPGRPAGLPTGPEPEAAAAGAQ